MGMREAMEGQIGRFRETVRSHLPVIVHSIDDLSNGLREKNATALEAWVMKRPWPGEYEEQDEMEYFATYVGKVTGGRDVVYQEDYGDGAMIPVDESENRRLMLLKTQVTALHRLRRLQSQHPDIPMKLIDEQGEFTPERLQMLEETRLHEKIAPFPIEAA